MARKGIVGSYKFGGLWQERERDFSSRRFAFLPNGRTLDFAASPETLFAPANINPNGLELREVTRPTDTFDGQQSVQAGYAMTDLTLGDKWRLTGGVRAERSHQRLVTYDPFAAGLNPISTDLENTDPLPSINLGSQLAPDMILRFGYSRSLNRPDFR